jgi:hypothetical protein
VDILWFFKERLRFVEQFYKHAASPFEETKSAIESHAEPYPVIDIEGGEPEYQAEWRVADESANVVGFCCLTLVQSSLEAFLRTALAQGAGYFPQLEKWEEEFKNANEKGWLRKYRAVFRDLLDADWEQSGANLEVLDQVNLTRDDFIHGLPLHSNVVYQRGKHSRLFPLSFFGNEFDLSVTLEMLEDELLKDGGHAPYGTRLEVSREKLDIVIHEVEKLAEYLAPIHCGCLNL